MAQWLRTTDYGLRTTDYGLRTMYKLLLCWRYLLTRYLALACIVSVMLGVATLIVVNSVMSGFSTKLKERLHGLISDIIIEAISLDGFAHAKWEMERIRKSPIGDKIEAMTPAVDVSAMLQFRKWGRTITRPVRVIGIDPTSRTAVKGFAEHLVRQKDSPNPSFELPPDLRWRYLQNHPPLLSNVGRAQPPDAGWLIPSAVPDLIPPPPDPPPSKWELPTGIIVGNAIASFRTKGATAEDPAMDQYVLDPGDAVVLTTVGSVSEGSSSADDELSPRHDKLFPVQARFVICDYFKSEMSEYDSNFVFVPLDYLQRIRAMDDRVTSIQIKLKDYADAKEVIEVLQPRQGHEGMFSRSVFAVQTWEDKQGPLLAAISVEKGILNILLFLIIAVAGFGILAIFSMIVV